MGVQLQVSSTGTYLYCIHGKRRGEWKLISHTNSAVIYKKHKHAVVQPFFTRHSHQAVNCVLNSLTDSWGLAPVSINILFTTVLNKLNPLNEQNLHLTNKELDLVQHTKASERQLCAATTRIISKYFGFGRKL